MVFLSCDFLGLLARGLSGAFLVVFLSGDFLALWLGASKSGGFLQGWAITLFEDERMVFLLKRAKKVKERSALFALFV